jgi:hypothetical protein
MDLPQIISSSTIKIKKYQRIKNVIKEHDEILGNEIDENEKFNEIKENMKFNIKFDQIDENHNVLIFKKNIMSFNIFFYFDWYPHVKHFVLIENDFDFIPVFQYLLEENAKFNARKWNIFIENKKINISFDNLFLRLISSELFLKSYFFSAKIKELNQCQTCEHFSKVFRFYEYYLCSYLLNNANNKLCKLYSKIKK